MMMSFVISHLNCGLKFVYSIHGIELMVAAKGGFSSLLNNILEYFFLRGNGTLCLALDGGCNNFCENVGERALHIFLTDHHEFLG